MKWVNTFSRKFQKGASKLGIIRATYQYVIIARRNLAYLTPNRNLDYLETNLVDHCNLNCKGCAHFAPLANAWFADVEMFENDMKRLSKIFAKIKTIKLMGGEPLLHPQVTEFLDTTRNYFPLSRIFLVTNGLLIEKMSEHFWDCCRNRDIVISMSVYPPTKIRKESIAHLLEEKKVKSEFKEITVFKSYHNFKGDSNPTKAFRVCRTSCANLREGKIYVCWVPPLAHYVNNKFGILIPTDNYIDIYSTNCTSKTVVKFLNKPSPVCSFCNIRHPEFPWKSSNFAKEEWDDATLV